MKSEGVVRLSAICRAAGAPRPATGPDPGPRGRAKRRVLLELQWHGRGGRFRHFVFSPPGVLRVLGTLSIFAVLVLAVLTASAVASSRSVAHSDIDAVLRENMELKARQEALRERAFDLAEQLSERFDQVCRMTRLADTPGHAWEGQCPRPPAREAGDEAILAWLSEQGARLEAIGNEMPAGQLEVGVKHASVPAPVTRARPSAHGEPALYLADMRPTGRRGATPLKR